MVKPGAAVGISYAVRPTEKELVQDAMLLDTTRLKYAAGTGDFTAFLTPGATPAPEPDAGVAVRSIRDASVCSDAKNAMQMARGFLADADISRLASDYLTQPAEDAVAVDISAGPPADRTVLVHVLGCSGLIPPGTNPNTDAYVVLKLGSEELRTAIVPKTTSPDYHQLFSFPAHADPGSRDGDERLRVEVWDRNRLREDTFLGHVTIDLCQLMAAPLARPPLRSCLEPALEPSDCETRLVGGWQTDSWWRIENDTVYGTPTTGILRVALAVSSSPQEDGAGHGRWHHFHAPLYISFVILHTKQTVGRENDCTAFV
jgi:hypothetical protein